METVEITASSLDDAKKQAAKKLGVDADSVTVEVIEETKGLFGRPGKIKVKATAEAASEEEAVEEKPKAKKAPAKKAPAKKKPAAKKAKAEKPKEEEPKEEEPAAEEKAEAPSEEEARPEAVATEDDAEKLIGILSSILEAGDIEATATCNELNGKYVNIELDGRDVGFLVGRRGEVLNALQYLCNIISARQLNNGVRVVLEGNNYRQRRQEALTNLASQIAEEVLNRGEEAVLDALPAFERRIVHQALMSIDGINTYSEGEEPNRRVVIAPQEN
jgi:spoIIIJ-associated protein